MRILLVNPPSFNEVMGNNPSIIETERGYNPPLGLLYVAAYLKDNSDHKIKVIDAQVEELDYLELENRIRKFQPDIVGLTAMTFTLIDVLNTLKSVKKIDGNIITVLGGPHVFIYPEETIAFPEVDFLVLGEGEVVFSELVRVLHEDSELSEVASIVYKTKEGKTVRNNIALLIDDLDKMPHPARQLTPYEKYSSLLARKNPATTLFTSRGCPYRCSFCLRPHLGKQYRMRSPENVVDEIKECIALGIEDFLVYDDTFTVNKKRVHQICDLIIKEGLDISWDCRARIDTVDESILKKMRKAGCFGIHYGIEAGTEKVLKNLRKGITIEQAKKVCDMTHDIGIKTLNYFMIGSPGETRQDIEETFKVIDKLKADYIHLTIFTPFPGTELYLQGLKEGLIKEDYWRDFARNPNKNFIPPHWPEYFTLDELKNLLIKGYKRFYLKPRNIFKIGLGIRTPVELYRKAKAGIKVFLMK